QYYSHQQADEQWFFDGYPHNQQLNAELYTFISTPVNNLIHDLSPSYQQMWIKHTFRIDNVKIAFTLHCFEYMFAEKNPDIFSDTGTVLIYRGIIQKDLCR